MHAGDAYQASQVYPGSISSKIAGKHSLNYPPSLLFRYLERLVRSLVYLPYSYSYTGKVTLPKTTSHIPDHSLHEDGRFSPTISHPPDPIDISATEQQEVV